MTRARRPLPAMRSQPEGWWRAIQDESLRTVKAAPHAATLIESLRDIGYSLETALADIVDNSITAHASRVDILADTVSDSPSIAIVDDGCGMDADELLRAMRPGSRNPLVQRETTDLGRFGLGLKTASFSQCRRLTVVSRKAGKTSAMRWDLDLVAREDDWLVQLIEDTCSVPGVERLGPQGTVVVWELLDRLAESRDRAFEEWNRKLADASEHLELVFHRFLAGERGLKRFAIAVNDRQLEPFDPFFSHHAATQRRPVERMKIRDQFIEVQAFTLPHHSRVTQAEWERYGGRGGYLKNQGFYLYRGKRLLLHGTWFGLARQTELTKLARVRIDTPNGLDVDWKVDVKKASAQPPAAVRGRLRRLIEELGNSSKRIYTHRGRRLIDTNRLPVWERRQAHGLISYHLNLDHPALNSFASKLAGDHLAEFRALLEMAAASLPLDALFADLGSDGNTIDTGWVPDDALLRSLVPSVRALQNSGVRWEEIMEILRMAEPFRSNWQRTERLLAGLTGGTDDDQS